MAIEAGAASQRAENLGRERERERERERDITALGSAVRFPSVGFIGGVPSFLNIFLIVNTAHCIPCTALP